MTVLFIEEIVEAFLKIIIGLVGDIFRVVNYAYRIFLALAKTNIFTSDNFSAISTNIYKILSVLMLFVLAYSILLKIVDPDSSKSGVDGKKTVQKLIVSLILIVLIPSIFSFAFDLQDEIISSNVLTAIFTGNAGNTDDSIKNGGIVMSANSFAPFFTPISPNGEDLENKSTYSTTSNNQTYGCDLNEKKCTLAQVREYTMLTGNFGFYKAFAKNIYDNEVEFQWLAALVTGVFLVYVMVSFCFDMALRICKLAFYQIIAPITIFCNVIPKMDDVFKKWMSNTIKTFINVFIRIIIMNFGVYLITIICDSDSLNLFSSAQDTGAPVLNLFVKCFIILGIVMFMKQSPKLLSDLFGIGDGDMKLGIKDKLKASGAFAVGAAVGAGTTGLVRNAVHGAQNVGKAEGFKGKLGAIGKTFGSSVAGAASGLTKGMWYAKGAGSAKDMKNAATQAANKTVENRNAREAYKAAHPGFGGTISGHFADAGDSALKWAGFNNIEALQRANDEMNKVSSKKKSLADAAESIILGEANKNKENSFGIDSSVQYKGKSFNVFDGNFDAKNVRTIRQKMDEAKISGSAMYNNVSLTASEWEDLYGDYLKNFKDAVQNQALKGEESWNNLTGKQRADLYEVRNAANDFRNELGRHLNESFVLNSNKAATSGPMINAETLEGDFKINEGAISELGDQIKIAQSENYAQISKIKQNEADKKGK